MNEFSVSAIITLIRKNWVYFVSVVSACVVVSYLLCTFVLTPTYQANVSFVATNGGVGVSTQDTDKIGSSDVASSLALMNTYVDILKTTNVYKELSVALNNKYSFLELKGMIRVEFRDEDSLFIDVFVTSSDPNEASIIANTFLTVGERYVSKSMNEPDKVLILKVEESASATKNFPNTALIVFGSAFIGFAAVFMILIVISVMDKTIKGEKDFSENYDIPILGSIPNFKAAAKGEKKYEKYSK